MTSVFLTCYLLIDFLRSPYWFVNLLDETLHFGHEVDTRLDIFYKLTSWCPNFKLPIGWCHIETCHSSTITGGDLKREGLSIEV